MREKFARESRLRLRVVKSVLHIIVAHIQAVQIIAMSEKTSKNLSTKGEYEL